MKKYLSSNPTFSDAINIVEPTDPAHADNVNAAPKQLLENTVHNKQRLDDLKNKILNTMEEIEANTDTENYVGALALKELSADLKNILEQISSNLAVDYLESDDTILNIVKANASNKIFCFRRAAVTNDAPAVENWDYTYIVIPVSLTGYLIKAYRAYSPEYVYHRFLNINENDWQDKWYKFSGNKM